MCRRRSRRQFGSSKYFDKCSVYDRQERLKCAAMFGGWSCQNCCHQPSAENALKSAPPQPQAEKDLLLRSELLHLAQVWLRLADVAALTEESSSKSNYSPSPGLWSWLLNSPASAFISATISVCGGTPARSSRERRSTISNKRSNFLSVFMPTQTRPNRRGSRFNPYYPRR
jgi:hypothetical protein